MVEAAREEVKVMREDLETRLAAAEVEKQGLRKLAEGKAALQEEVDRLKNEITLLRAEMIQADAEAVQRRAEQAEWTEKALRLREATEQSLSSQGQGDSKPIGTTPRQSTRTERKSMGNGSPNSSVDQASQLQGSRVSEWETGVIEARVQFNALIPSLGLTVRRINPPILYTHPLSSPVHDSETRLEQPLTNQAPVQTGLLIQGVESWSSVHPFGVGPGQVILLINGRPANDVSVLVETVRLASPGDVCSLTLLPSEHTDVRHASVIQVRVGAEHTALDKVMSLRALAATVLASDSPSHGPSSAAIQPSAPTSAGGHYNSGLGDSDFPALDSSTRGIPSTSMASLSSVTDPSANTTLSTSFVPRAMDTSLDASFGASTSPIQGASSPVPHSLPSSSHPHSLTTTSQPSSQPDQPSSIQRRSDSASSYAQTSAHSTSSMYMTTSSSTSSSSSSTSFTTGSVTKPPLTVPITRRPSITRCSLWTDQLVAMHRGRIESIINIMAIVNINMPGKSSIDMP